MRKIALITITAVAGALVACSNETTAPGSTDNSSLITDEITQFSIGAFGTALTSVGAYEADLFRLRLAHAFPDEIKLTADQEAQISALVAAFEADTKVDRAELHAILLKAEQARRAHKSKNEIKAILDQGIPIRAKLTAAQAEFRAHIEAVLTPAQRAWLATHAPARCDPTKFPSLTDAQIAQMKALEEAFEHANKADIEAIKTGLRQMYEALQAGKSKADVQAIFDSFKPALDRVQAARQTLRAQLEAVLTPEQKASGCLPLG